MKAWALQYHDRTSRRPQGERVARSMVGHIGRAASLLDVGCGDGANAQRIAEAVGATRLEGVDVVLRPTRRIPTQVYDGLHVPFEDRAFEVVTLIDVLHHCTEPQKVLDEAVRVAARCVVIKDHFAFGPLTHKMLYWMDLAGNAKDGIASPGTYFEPRRWVEMVDRAGGRIAAIDWPLKTHDLPWRIVGWPELQFTARIERR